MKATSIKMGSNASGMVTNIDLCPGYCRARSVRSEVAQKHSVEPRIMIHASANVDERPCLLIAHSNAIETTVVTSNPARNQIRLDDPPPRRAAGILTGVSVRFGILEL